MKSHIKIPICVLLLVSLVFQAGAIAHAMEITPFNIYTSYLHAGLSISSGTATVSGDVTGSSSKYSVSGTLTLQQYKNGKWVSFKSWPKESGKGSLSITKTWKVDSGYKYRTKFVSDVNGELLSKYSAEKSA